MCAAQIQSSGADAPPLTWLELSGSKVTDLAPLKKKNWQYLGLSANTRDYTVLRGMTIYNLNCPTPLTKAKIASIKGIKGLKVLNGKDAKFVLP